MPRPQQSLTTPVELEECRSPRRFLDVQRHFYRDDPHYVPPITLADSWQVNPAKSPFFEHAEGGFWIARRGREPVGRISAVRDALHDEFHGNRIGFFGHFEATDEPAAHALLERASDWLHAHGATALRGPVDLSTNYRCGLLVGGEAGTPMLMMPHNPPAYADYLESWGLAKVQDLLALLLLEEEATPERFERLAERIRKRTGARIRALNMRAFEAEIETCWRIYSEAWSENWGFVPMTLAEFMRSAKELKLIADRELLTIVEIEGEPAAFAFTVPDVNVAAKACNGRLLPFGWVRFLRALKRTSQCRVVTLGVLPAYRKLGLDGLLLLYYTYKCPERGYPRCEASWILEHNVEMIRVLESLGAREYRRYRVYEKAL